MAWGQCLSPAFLGQLHGMNVVLARRLRHYPVDNPAATPDGQCLSLSSSDACIARMLYAHQEGREHLAVNAGEHPVSEFQLLQFQISEFKLCEFQLSEYQYQASRYQQADEILLCRLWILTTYVECIFTFLSGATAWNESFLSKTTSFP